ncbi:hypothetical protein AYI69_g2716, partial [Smittium culicis]
MPISFEVFPPKFGGTKEENKTLVAWSTSFADAIAFNSCSSEVSINLFKLWLQGDAATWRMKLQPVATEEKWSLETWLSKIKIRFAREEIDGDLVTLSQMKKDKDKSWIEFNNEINAYINTIPKDLYTEKWLKKTYLEIVSRADLDIWKIIYKESKDEPLQKVMIEVVATSKLLSQGLQAIELNAKEGGNQKIEAQN